MFNAIKPKPITKAQGDKGLMYVEVSLLMLWLTRDQHTISSLDEAKWLEIRTTMESRWLKAVNLEAKPLHIIAHGIDICIGTWSGKIDLTVTPMDDFQVVIGIDFLGKLKAVPLPFLRSMAILEEKTPSMVHAVQGKGSKPCFFQQCK